MENFNFKESRKSVGLTQSELAEKLGVSRQTIVNYEKGEVIPESKKLLLKSIFNKEILIVNEPPVDYEIRPKYLQQYNNDLSLKKEYEKTVELNAKIGQDSTLELQLIEIIEKRLETIRKTSFNHDYNL